MLLSRWSQAGETHDSWGLKNSGRLGRGMSDQSEEGGGGDGWEGTQTGTSGTRIEHDSDSRLFMEADKAKSQGQGCVTVKGRY